MLPNVGGLDGWFAPYVREQKRRAALPEREHFGRVGDQDVVDTLGGEAPGQHPWGYVVQYVRVAVAPELPPGHLVSDSSLRSEEHTVLR